MTLRRKRVLVRKCALYGTVPIFVIDRLSNVTYRIGLNNNKNNWKVVHFDRLKAYIPQEPVDR